MMGDFEGLLTVMLRAGVSESIAASPKSMLGGEIWSVADGVCELAEAMKTRSKVADAPVIRVCRTFNSCSLQPAFHQK